LKKVFIVLGIIALLLIIFAAASVNYVAFRGRQLDASSKAYVDANIPVIVSSWSADELLKRSSGEFRRATDDKQLNLMFTKLKQLGQFQKYEGSKGESNTIFNYKSAKETKMANYVATATFQNGSAYIKVELIQENGQWLIYGFSVDMPILLK
jgi:hypothetical protein